MVAIGVFTADFAEQNRRDLRAMGYDADTAREVGLMAAPVQAVVEHLGNLLPLGKIPGLGKVFTNLARPIAFGNEAVQHYLSRSALIFVGENIQEKVQDNLVVPAMQQLYATVEGSAALKPDWGFYGNRAVQSAPELALTLIPAALLFGAAATHQQLRLSQDLTTRQGILEAVGYSSAQAAEIRLQDSPDARLSKAQAMWDQRAGTPQTMEAAAQQMAEAERLRRVDAAAAKQELEQRGLLLRDPPQGGLTPRATALGRWILMEPG